MTIVESSVFINIAATYTAATMTRWSGVFRGTRYSLTSIRNSALFVPACSSSIEGVEVAQPQPIVDIRRHWIVELLRSFVHSQKVLNASAILWYQTSRRCWAKCVMLIARL